MQYLKMEVSVASKNPKRLITISFEDRQLDAIDSMGIKRSQFVRIAIRVMFATLNGNQDVIDRSLQEFKVLMSQDIV